MDRIDMLKLHIVSPSGYRRRIFYTKCACYRIVVMWCSWLSGLLRPVGSGQTWYCWFTWLATDWSINDVDHWPVFGWLIDWPVWPRVNDNPVCWYCCCFIFSASYSLIKGILSLSVFPWASSHFTCIFCLHLTLLVFHLVHSIFSLQHTPIYCLSPALLLISGQGCVLLPFSFLH